MVSVPSIRHEGTRFVVAIIGDATFTPYLYIVATVETIVKIQIPSQFINETTTVQPGTAIRPFSQNLGPELNGQCSVHSNKGILVSANNPVYFSTGTIQYDSGDGTIMLPTSALGNQYFVIGHNSTVSGKEMFIVIGTEADTQVTIYLPSGAQETFVLGLWETYFRSEAFLSGTFIDASTEVGVIAGHLCAHIPAETDQNCDYIDEFMPPVRSYGKVFIVSYMRPRTSFSIGVLASVNNTYVNITDSNGEIVETIHLYRSQATWRAYYDSNILALVSNTPILVVQYGHGGKNSDIHGDPSMMLIPATGNYVSEYHFHAPSSWTEPADLAVVIREGFEMQLILDSSSANIVSSNTVAVPGIGQYIVAYLEVYAGHHSLSHGTSEPFGAWLYARGSDYEEYAMCLGMLT